MSLNPVVHFEMPYLDGRRVAKFYNAALGWKMISAGEKMGNYLIANTAETDENGMVKTPGAINGGFYPLESAPESKEPSLVISVEDMKASMEKVVKAGGTILGKPTDIPGVGLYVSFRDTEGNRVSLLQPHR